MPEVLKQLSQAYFGKYSGVEGDSTYDNLWGGSVNAYEAGTWRVELSNLAASTEYRIAVLCARANSATGSATWTGTTGDSFSWKTYTLGGDGSLDSSDLSNSATVSFASGSNGSSGTILELVATTDASGNLSFSTGSNSKFTFNGMVITQIPEPSAFGLLAGLGALALVASRRRRSRKA